LEVIAIMITILNLQIMIKRLRLEYLINNNYMDLQNKEVINCSKELDKLIAEYQRLVIEEEAV